MTDSETTYVIKKVLQGTLALILLVLAYRRFAKTATKRQRGVILLLAVGIFILFPAFMAGVIYALQPVIDSMSGTMLAIVVLGACAAYVAALTGAVVHFRRPPAGERSSP